MSENNLNILGRKIFFLHPSSFIQNQIINELTQEEFEVYTAKNEAKLKQTLRNYPDAVVFVNHNEGLKPAGWEEWIIGMMADPETSKVDIGVLTASDSVNLRKKYTEQIRVRCGFTVLKSDLQLVCRTLVAILENVNAKGRRKYLRAVTDKEVNITVNIPLNGTFINGIIKDISTVGFSCTFAEDPDIAKNSLIPDLQIRLATQLIKAEGIVFGSRMEGEQKVYVILLSQKTSPDVRTRIRKFIQFFLQARMDPELK